MNTVMCPPDWLTPEQQADPDVAEFIRRSRRAKAEEKTSSPEDWTVEQRSAWDAGDWRRFSRLRGYTEAEIANFAEFIRLANELDARYGPDFAICLDFDIQQWETARAVVQESPAT